LPSRHADEPAPVSQVTLDLADDVRHGERRQVYAPSRLEAIDGLDQPDRPDLHQIFHVLTSMGEAVRERLDERQVRLDESFAGRKVALRPVGAMQPRCLCARKTSFVRFAAFHFRDRRL
jgi:hypothetical protein